jgi:hypothetical protein
MTPDKNIEIIHFKDFRRDIVVKDHETTRRNIENIHREKPGEISRKLTMKRRTKYLHIDGERPGKTSRKFDVRHAT